MSFARASLRSVLAAGVSLAALPAAFANADAADAEPEDVIVVQGSVIETTAGKTGVPIAETARSISVESLQDILDKGALDLDDAFLYTPGAFGQVYGFDTRGDWIKVRGLDVPEYQDGLQSHFGFYNDTRPEIFFLQQVEILRGPAAVLYGQGSPGGLVNVVTKRPEFDPSSQVMIEAGNFNRRQVGIDFTGPVPGTNDTLAFRLLGLARESDTQIDFVEDDALAVSPSLTWRPNDRSQITLIANYQERRGDAGHQFLHLEGTHEPAPNGEFIDPDFYAGEPEFNRFDMTSGSLTLLGSYDLNSSITLEVTSRYTASGADYNQAWPAYIGGNRWVFNPDGSLYGNGTVPRPFYRSDAWTQQFGTDVRLRAEFTTGRAEHRLLAGAFYQDVTTENDFAYAYALGYDFATGGPDAVFGDEFWINMFDPEYGNFPDAATLDRFWFNAPVNSTEDMGLYVHDHIELDNWRFTLGLRSDRVETDNGYTTQEDDAVSATAAVMYRFENGVMPYVSYAESFEPIVGTAFDGSPFDPEEGTQYELGVKYEPGSFPGLISFAVFDIEQSNLLQPDANNPGFSVQTGEVRVQGAELEALAALGDFTVEFNASQLNSENAAGFNLASVPDHQVSAWLGYRPSGAWQGFKSGLGVRYVGESHDGADAVTTDGYTLVDAMVGYEAEAWDLTLSVRNLFDEEYFATCLSRGDCFPGVERTAVARLTYSF